MSKEAAELVEFIVKPIVEHPDEVKVEIVDGSLELETNADDRGRVIGRQGRIAKAMRAVVEASAVGEDCHLEIVD